MEDLLALGGDAGARGAPGPARLSAYDAGRQSWGLSDFRTAYACMIITSVLTGLWVLVNLGSFIAWFCVAFFTVDVEFWPRLVFERSTTALVAGSVVLSCGYALVRRRR